MLLPPTRMNKCSVEGPFYSKRVTDLPNGFEMLHGLARVESRVLKTFEDACKYIFTGFLHQCYVPQRYIISHPPGIQNRLRYSI